MSPKSHTRKVTAQATRKKTKSPFRCDNCGATFTSESERRSHQKTEHPAKSKKSAG